jgi:hypothetical protein
MSGSGLEMGSKYYKPSTITQKEQNFVNNIGEE